jgi:hypothetical protein
MERIVVNIFKTGDKADSSKSCQFALSEVHAKYYPIFL